MYFKKAGDYLITVVCGKVFEHEFYSDGSYCKGEGGECLLFPSKDQRDWSKFQRPFKDGDVVTYKLRGSLVAFIYKERTSTMLVESHCALYAQNMGFSVDGDIALKEEEIVFATEEEKEKLFKAIKENGYKWNPETKTLGKLIEPIFEVGNKIEKCGYRFTIAEVKDDYYLTKYGNKIPFDNQDDFSLVPNKFDIATLKPFESRVLMRSSNAREWVATFYSHYNNNKFYGCGMCCDQCIPWEGNQHLLGTTDDCDGYYKIWE